MNRKITLTLVPALFLAFAGVHYAHAQYEQYQDIELSTEAHESERTVTAAEVLPPELLEGEFHRVASSVRNDCAVNYYTLETPFGSYEVYGKPLLELRIRETYALANMKQISGDEIVWESAKRIVTSPFKALASFARHPVQTLKGVPDGVSRSVRLISDDVSDVVHGLQHGGGGDGDTKMSEEVSRASWSLMGLGGAERRWARKLQINPYSDNEALRERLKQIAKIDSGASLGLSFAPLPKLLSEGGMLNDTYKMVWDLGARELLDLNHRRLLAMGASEELIKAYFDNETLSVWHDVVIVNLMEAMEGVENRPALIEQALSVESISDAQFLVESIALAYWFHSQESPLSEFLGASNIPIARSADGRTLLFAATDWVCWDSENDQAAVYFTEAFLTGGAKGEMWLSGGASEMFVKGVGDLGWAVRGDNRDQVMPWIMNPESRASGAPEGTPDT